jgi:hypothetical protein
MKTIEVSDETYEKIKGEIGETNIVEVSSYDDLIGLTVFVRTVTYHWVGKVVKMIGGLLELKDAVWVADSGRWMQAIKDGTLNEYEETGRTFVKMDAVVDITPWNHKIPKGQK